MQIVDKFALAVKVIADQGSASEILTNSISSESIFSEESAALEILHNSMSSESI